MVDCVITRQPGRYSNRVISACKKTGTPYLIEMVGCPWDSLWNHSIWGKLLALSATLQTKRNLKEASFVIYVTKHFLQNRYPTKGLSTYCSNVTLPKQNIEILNKRLKHIENLKKNIIKIGTVAAVDVKYKGQQYIIKALASLKKKDNPTRYEYHLVGGGNQSYLKYIIKKFDMLDNVIFYGSLKHDEVFNFLDNIDLYVQPSLQEGLPRALIEAMSRGLPCFGARTGGIPELLGHKFIFSNGMNRENEIHSIISSFSKDEMLEQASRNFHEAQQYEAEIIDRRRCELFSKFLKTVKYANKD
jgi:glycosyltransferase involved in cell wall biosynthesis